MQMEKEYGLHRCNPFHVFRNVSCAVFFTKQLSGVFYKGFICIGLGQVANYRPFLCVGDGTEGECQREAKPGT